VEQRRSRIRSLAADVAPLLDRCGRLLADLAPHVLALTRDDVMATEAEPDAMDTTTLAPPSSSSPNAHPALTTATDDSGPAVPRVNPTAPPLVRRR